ncbi:MAG: radical SAM protein [Aquamicrobium sp.]|jgi:MoaA/NifB/PqqE/SkfB family radical SAM enzyme|nr:radical SAM protein [Mesorhizobium sp. Pch-S]MBR2692329.1 radical SAM protein [Aquamicrobium sp.]QAZ46302.1 hypothetical protein C1M53_28645 [Mesorhizobium sp. Pch-S]
MVATYDNSSRFKRIVSRLRPYTTIVLAALREGVPATNLARTAVPFWLRDADTPPILSVEFLNSCNLRCVYCNVEADSRPRGTMTIETFNRVRDDIQQFKIKRVRIGGGEPTLHPQFADFASQLARASPWVSIVSNGQWRSEEIPRALLSAPLNLIEVSVDVGGKQGYERLRVRGSFDRLVSNLSRLKELRQELGSPSKINIRLMVGPADDTPSINREVSFWRQFADTVMIQRLMQLPEIPLVANVFHSPQQREDLYPKCSLPLKHMIVHFDGVVPLCGASYSAGGEKRAILGDISRQSLGYLWLKAMQPYRDAHRSRRFGGIKACKGCIGV